MKLYPIKIKIDGVWEEGEVEATETLLDALRNKFGRKEVKNGCAVGDCGACAVLLNGVSVNSCLTLAAQADGCEVTTVRGIGTEDDPHPIQKSFVENGAIQCGFCTAGMVVSAKEFLDHNPHPSRDEIREAMSGHLCRCTGYVKIIDAIEDAARQGDA